MLVANQSLLRVLVDEEIERVVAEASRNGFIVRSGTQAELLLRAFPQCGLDPRQLVDAIVAAAAAGKVPVEIDHMEPNAQQATGLNGRSIT